MVGEEIKKIKGLLGEERVDRKTTPVREKGWFCAKAK